MFDRVKKWFQRRFNNHLPIKPTNSIKILYRADLYAWSKNKKINDILMSDFRNMSNEKIYSLIVFVDGAQRKILKDSLHVFPSGQMLKLDNYTISNFKCTDATDVLLENGYIDVFWNSKDVIERADYMGYEFYSNELDIVLEIIKDIHDSELGLSWNTIDDAIKILRDEKS